MSEKGFKSVTTKAISDKAGVSEMTVYRHFRSKINILEEVMERFYFTAPMKRIFEEDLVWEIEIDLLHISKKYHEVMKKNKKIFEIAVKETHTLPSILDKITKHPRELKEFLVHYFVEMHKNGKIIKMNFELLAVSFIWMNYGSFISRSFSGEDKITTFSQEEFIESSVAQFAKAIKT
ncbi:TetR/AcrR family transcriptional regulator [Peribacillus saganii]|uniref:TetR/AcrR family transcriptional regulator n=2 Tax=Peribacillus saganii TaxID=2303992 RepID=A0A372LQU9_9BACI|nr:TetR/AcrR family transcriptional regulator [Peribacillus saganii]